MFIKHPKDKSFLDVAIAFIVVGAVFTALGIIWSLVGWALSSSPEYGFYKLFGGLVIMGIGYIQLQLELMRHK